MVNFNKFQSITDLKEYYEELLEIRFDLEDEVARERKKIVAYYKKDRKVKTANLDGQEIDEIFQKLIAYRDYILEEWANTNEDCTHLVKLNEECEEIKNAFEQMRKFHSKTNNEWLTIITDSMNQRGKRKYSIKFFDREFEYVGIGTHSEETHYHNAQIDTVAVIVADDFDIDSVHNYAFSWPEEHSNDYANNDFILYEHIYGKVEPKEYLAKEKTIFGLYGMPDAVKLQISDLAFQELKQQMAQEKVAVKHLV